MQNVALSNGVMRMLKSLPTPCKSMPWVSTIWIAIWSPNPASDFACWLKDQLQQLIFELGIVQNFTHNQQYPY